MNHYAIFTRCIINKKFRLLSYQAWTRRLLFNLDVSTSVCFDVCLRESEIAMSNPRRPFTCYFCNQQIENETEMVNIFIH